MGGILDRRDIRKSQSRRHARRGRHFPEISEGRRGRTPSKPPRNAFAKWRLVPAPRRAEIVFRAAEMLLERKEEYSRDMTREMGKILKETRGDTQEAIDTAYYFAGEGRRLFGPTTPSELPNKFAMAVRHAHRRLRHDHAVEFSHGDSVVEASSRHRLRQHLRDQAGAGHAAFHLQPGAHPVRCGRAQGRDQYRQRIRPAGGWAADGASRSPRHFADRIDRGRAHRRHHRGQELQALLAGTGRQESHDRARRRQPRPRHRRRTLGRLRNHRPALHRHQPHHRAEGRLRGVRRALCRSRQAPESGQWHG